MIPQAFQDSINRDLQLFFNRKCTPAERFDKRLVEVVDQIAQVTLRGGDRMRPFLCQLGYQAASGESVNSIRPALLALEMFHTFALIHDDIMDVADTRRGGQTIHAYFSQNNRSKLLGGNLAILAGDLAHVWAGELFESLPDGKSKSIAKKLFNTMQEEVIYGQMSDVWGARLASTKELLSMYSHKSGNYSVEKPLLIGGALANAGKDQLQALSQYGQLVGIAFQLRDDILGVFGNQKKTGKSVSGDILEGKWTWLVHVAYNKLNNRERKQMLSILGNRLASKSEVDWMRQVIKDTGARKLVEQKMRRLVKNGIKALRCVRLQNKMELEKISRFVVEREE